MKLNLFSKSLTLAILLGCLTSPAIAQDSCLSRVSNSDLVDELARRLGTSPGSPAGSVAVSAACRTNDLTYTVTNLDSGQSKQGTAKTTTSAKCSLYADQINAKSPRLSNGGQFATCWTNDLTIVAISRSGQISETVQRTTTSESCEQTATRINQ